ncbi:MAG: hypothetical protein ABW250_01680 [Pyrinomonadaceae bacterium]
MEIELGNKFFLPIIRPPEKKFNPFSVSEVVDALNIAETIAYYGDLQAQGVNVLASPPPAPGSPMEILIENSDVTHETDEEEPVSTVFAMTRGFVSYKAGEITLRVWPADFKSLAKLPDGPPRPNRIVYGSLDADSVEEAIEEQVAELDEAILKESWTQTNSGAAPDREAFEAAFVERFMDGDAEVYVEAGTALGEASIIPAAANAPVARLTLAAFFDAAGSPPSIEVAPEDLIDNALRPKLLLLFTGHPLVKAVSGPVQIHFKSRFFIWDNTSGVQDYVPLANGQVTLLAGPNLSNLPSLPFDTYVEAAPPFFTDANGFIDVIAPPLPSRALIRFRYATAGNTYGVRTYAEDVETNPHKARQYVDNLLVNTKEYRAKYEFFPKYKSFVNDLAEHGDDEQYGADRGNMEKYEKTIQPLALGAISGFIPAITHRDMLKHIRQFEEGYKASVIPPKSKTLNILFEGDSWVNYPVAFNDIYGHLDQFIWSKTKPDVTYNRIPLQHFGDRSNQMFYAASPTDDRQWNYTRDALSEYKIDLIVISSGGNDVAEPGISNSAGKAWVTDNFTDGYFDPFLAQGTLSGADMDTAERLLKLSFSVMLKNHRWYSYFNPGVVLKDEAQMKAVLDPLLAALNQDFGPSNPQAQAGSLDEIGHKVIANFPDTFALGSNEDLLFKEVFDAAVFAQRFAAVKTNLSTLLDEAQNRGIPVITHTYCYPLFSENPTSYFGEGDWRITGPWFAHRFREAKVLDRRIQKICLKVILDRFVTDILQPLKAAYPLFNYVDVRRLNASTDTWRDEMHLRGGGFREVASKIYDAIAAHPNLSNFFQ